jgi:hypothetical protein
VVGEAAQMAAVVVDKEVDTIIVAVEAAVLLVMQVGVSHFSNNSNNSMTINRILTWNKTMEKEVDMLVHNLVVVVINNLVALAALDSLTRCCRVQRRDCSDYYYEPLELLLQVH